MTTPASVRKGGTWLLEDAAASDVFTPERLTDEHRLMAQTTTEFVQSEVLPMLDRMEQSSRFLENGQYNYSAQQEREIERQLGEVERQISQAASTENNSEEAKLQENLNRASNTIRSLESIQRRMQELADEQ